MKGVDVKYMTKDKRVRFTLRLPNNLIEDLKNQANRQGISINALILNILWEWVEKNIEN
jgi:predicted HicB family RNase H-like nuclease